MANTINKDKIIALSIANNSDKCNVNILITENYCTKFTIMSFLVSALQFPATNSILKKISGFATGVNTSHNEQQVK